MEKVKFIRLILSLVLFIGCSNLILAQDIIYMCNGEEIEAVIHKISSTEIEYKKYSNQNGPIYTMEKTAILMIKYKNGEKDIFTETPPTQKQITETKDTTSVEIFVETTLPSKLTFQKGSVYDTNGKSLSDAELRSIYADIPEALEMFNSKSKFNAPTTIFATFSVLGGIMTTVCLIWWDWDATLTYGLLTTGFIIPCKIFGNAAKKRVANSVDIYNNINSISYKKDNDISLQLGLTNTGGVGFRINF